MFIAFCGHACGGESAHQERRKAWFGGSKEKAKKRAALRGARSHDGEQPSSAYALAGINKRMLVSQRNMNFNNRASLAAHMGAFAFGMAWRAARQQRGAAWRHKSIRRQLSALLKISNGL